MEGLIPYLIHTIKRTKHVHNQGYTRSLSDGSRRGYQLLGSAGESVNGSSHRRTRSEFQAPGFGDLQPEVDQFIRSHSFKSNTTNNNDDAYVVTSGTSYSDGLRQIHHSSHVVANNYNNVYHQKEMNKVKVPQY
ncbi:hypothetical protein vseg_000770 [Gypsophila vaccaria]